MAKRPKPSPTPFGQRLREMREAAGLSLTQLGERAGIRWSAIGRLETSGTANPTLDTIQKLAAALGCKASDLMPDEPGTTPAAD